MGLPVHHIRTKMGRSFLVEHRGVLTLIDTGWRGSDRRILRALEAIGRKPDDIGQILLTHSHGDHSGSAARMRERLDAPIVASAIDAEVIAGREPYAHAPAVYARAAYGFLAGYERFDVDRTLTDRTEIEGGLIVIPAPGHTRGHVAVWAPDHRALFAGDAVWNLGPVRLSWRPFTQDPERNRESVRELADLPADGLFLGHGAPVRRDGRERLRSLVR